jgi:hypothetical protein
VNVSTPDTSITHLIFLIMKSTRTPWPFYDVIVTLADAPPAAKQQLVCIIGEQPLSILTVERLLSGVKRFLVLTHQLLDGWFHSLSPDFVTVFTQMQEIGHDLARQDSILIAISQDNEEQPENRRYCYRDREESFFSFVNQIHSQALERAR